MGEVSNLHAEEDTEPRAQPEGGRVQEVPVETDELPRRTAAVLVQVQVVVEVVHHSNTLQAEAGGTQAHEDHVGGKQPPTPHPFPAQHQHNEAVGQDSQEAQQDKEQHEEG